MPTYEYRCNACDHEFETIHSITAGALRKCPACGKLKLERLISRGGGIIFKGSGFYETDYRSKEYKEKARPDPKMSLNPSKHYKEFTTWEEYTGKLVYKKTEDFYSWEEWQEKVKEISPSSETDYKEKVRRNPKMPQHPRVQYAEHWTGWRPFTGKRSGLKKEELYCWEEWKEKVKEMKPTSSLDYQKRAQTSQE